MHNGKLANITRKECPAKLGVMYLKNKCFALR